MQPRCAPVMLDAAAGYEFHFEMAFQMVVGVIHVCLLVLLVGVDQEDEQENEGCHVAVDLTIIFSLWSSLYLCSGFT